MRIKVLYFSSIKDKLKKNFEEIDIKEKATVKELINVLKEKYPQIKENLDKALVAVNEEYADDETVLKEGDTVALIPPVSGG
jgi:molybdopterin synthase sulfur carrier subunit